MWVPNHVHYWNGGIRKERYCRKNQRFRHIKQRSEINWTEVGRKKVTDIDYNTVAPYYTIN